MKNVGPVHFGRDASGHPTVYVGVGGWLGASNPATVLRRIADGARRAASVARCIAVGHSVCIWKAESGAWLALCYVDEHKARTASVGADARSVQ